MRLGDGAVCPCGGAALYVKPLAGFCRELIHTTALDYVPLQCLDKFICQIQCVTDLMLEFVQARQSLGETDGKFRTLYQDKYVPLKAEHKKHADLYDSLAHEHSQAVTVCS